MTVLSSDWEQVMRKALVQPYLSVLLLDRLVPKKNSNSGGPATSLVVVDADLFVQIEHT